jgi:hypothetical protein
MSRFLTNLVLAVSVQPFYSFSPVPLRVAVSPVVRTFDEAEDE